MWCLSTVYLYECGLIVCDEYGVYGVCVWNCGISMLGG